MRRPVILLGSASTGRSVLIPQLIQLVSPPTRVPRLAGHPGFPVGLSPSCVLALPPNNPAKMTGAANGHSQEPVSVMYDWYEPPRGCNAENLPRSPLEHCHVRLATAAALSPLGADLQKFLIFGKSGWIGE